MSPSWLARAVVGDVRRASQRQGTPAECLARARLRAGRHHGLPAPETCAATSPPPATAPARRSRAAKRMELLAAVTVRSAR